jgi:hypothetical protein
MMDAEFFTDVAAFEREVSALLKVMTNKDYCFKTVEGRRPRFVRARRGQAGTYSEVCEFDFAEVRAAQKELKRVSNDFAEQEWNAALRTNFGGSTARHLTPAIASCGIHNLQLALVLHGAPWKIVAKKNTDISRFVPIAPPKPYNGNIPAPDKPRMFPSHYCAKCRKTRRQRYAFTHNKCWQQVLT